MYPCKDCKSRYPACHDKCEAYQRAKEEEEAIKENRRKFTNIEMAVIDLKQDVYLKHWRKHR